MQILSIASVSGVWALVLSAPMTAWAAVAPSQVVDILNDFASQATDLQAYAKKVSTADSVLIKVKTGPLYEVVAGFKIAVSQGQAAFPSFAGTAAITDTADCDNIAAAYDGFADAHNALFNILIQKAGLFSIIPNLGKPVYQQLKAVEGLINTITIGFLEPTVPSEAAHFETVHSGLNRTLDTCIQSYQGI